MSISVVKTPPKERLNRHYVCNRAPLSANPIVKLPLGSVRPTGWLRHQLDLMTDGMTGRLDEVSHFVADDNGWLGGDKEGWEEQAYWFRGFYAMAVLAGFINRIFALPGKLAEMEVIPLSRNASVVLETIGIVAFFLVVGIFGVWVIGTFLKNLRVLRGEEERS